MFQTIPRTSNETLSAIIKVLPEPASIAVYVLNYMPDIDTGKSVIKFKPQSHSTPALVEAPTKEKLLSVINDNCAETLAVFREASFYLNKNSLTIGVDVPENIWPPNSCNIKLTEYELMIDYWDIFWCPHINHIMEIASQFKDIQITVIKHRN